MRMCTDASLCLCLCVACECACRCASTAVCSCTYRPEVKRQAQVLFLGSQEPFFFFFSGTQISQPRLGWLSEPQGSMSLRPTRPRIISAAIIPVLLSTEHQAQGLRACVFKKKKHFVFILPLPKRETCKTPPLLVP